VSQALNPAWGFGETVTAIYGMLAWVKKNIPLIARHHLRQGLLFENELL
jgi:hypothetical protein